MFPNLNKIHVLASMMVALLMSCLTPLWVSAEVENVINEVVWEENRETGEFTLHVLGSLTPVYTMYELFSPQRIVLDMASSSLSPSLNLPLVVQNGPVAEVNGDMVTGQDSNIARLEIELNSDIAYSVKQSELGVAVVFSQHIVPLGVAGADSLMESKVTDVQVDAVAPEKATVVIYSSGPIGEIKIVEEKKNEFHAARLILDFPSLRAEDKVIPVVLDSPVTLVQVKQETGASAGARFILDSADNELFTYEIQSQGNYAEIILSAKITGSIDDAEMVAMLTGHGAEGGSDDFLAFAEDSPELSTMAFSGDESPVDSVEVPNISNMNFAGYGEQKISVDFYKIDLHNVFRLIGEISNRNVIVDESVSGSLTLAMKDVPWDFLLDVVLNLKDLEKEERFNTIVISPSSEGFTWPESVATELEVTVEPITVTKRLQTSKDKIQAKKLIYQASKLLEKDDAKGALSFYEKAFQAWPENGDLANQIATIALAKLGQNAKAAHYSKIAVQENPEDYKAALIAAMSLANMEEVQEAKEYFDLAVSGVQPTQQAIASYAAFSEQNGSFDAALALLDQYDQVYGNTLETMISRARIYDSMADVAQADKIYNQILLSGYELPVDLKNYLDNRINGIQ